MADGLDAAETAWRIYRDRRKGERFAPLSLEEQSRGLTFAYDVQDKLIETRLQGSNKCIAGYKIGLTSPSMLELCGIDTPIIGKILDDNILQSGVSLQRSEFVRLGLECEIAVRIARPLTTGFDDASDQEVIDTLECVCAAFEVIEDRDANYSALDAQSIIADNSWNAGAVLGEAVAPQALTGLAARLLIDGELSGEGGSSDVLGNPINSIRAVASHLAARGSGLNAGDWILTGSIIATKFPRPGSRFRFEVGSFPPVEAHIV